MDRLRLRLHLLGCWFAYCFNLKVIQCHVILVLIGPTGLSREGCLMTLVNISSRYVNFTAGNTGLTFVLSAFVLALEGPGSNSELGSSSVFSTLPPFPHGFSPEFPPAVLSLFSPGVTESCNHRNPHWTKLQLRDQKRNVCVRVCARARFPVLAAV